MVTTLHSWHPTRINTSTHAWNMNPVFMKNWHLGDNLTLLKNHVLIFKLRDWIKKLNSGSLWLMMKKVLLGVSYQLVCSLGGLLRCGGVMGQIWRSTCTSRGHRLLTYQEVKVERLIAPLLVWALGRWRCGGKKGDIWTTGEGEWKGVGRNT